MPWSRSSDPENSKAAKALRRKWETDGPDNRLFDACFRIQREASAAAGRRRSARRRKRARRAGVGRRGESLLTARSICGAMWSRWETGFRRARMSGASDAACVSSGIVGRNSIRRARHIQKARGLQSPILRRVTGARGQKREGRNFHTWALTGGAVSSSAYNGGDHETRGVGLGRKGLEVNAEEDRDVPEGTGKVPGFSARAAKIRAMCARTKTATGSRSMEPK